jgi:hypothetical protein
MIGLYEQKLFRLIEKWGGKVVCIETHKQYDKLVDFKFNDAPFTNNDIGVNFRTKTLYYSKECPPGWPEIIHDMGHIFGSKHGPTNKKCQETHFFGWEYLLAKKIKAPMEEWYNNNDYYRINPECKCHKHESAKNSRLVFPEFGEFGKKCQLKIVNYWIEFGNKYGNIKDREAIPVR